MRHHRPAHAAVTASVAGGFKRPLMRLVAIMAGSLFALDMIAGQASAATWQRCPNDIGSGYNCTVTLDVVNARNQPDPNGLALYQYQPDQWIEILCWVHGSNVNGDGIWYWSHPEGGPLPAAYVPGYLLDTGHDPYPAAPEC